MSLISVKGIRKSYVTEGKEVPILKGISFQIYEGEFVSFMGPSGSGKSTLFSILAGLMSPSEGSYLFTNKELVGLSLSELAEWRNQTLGFVFQDYLLLDGLTAIENVMLPLHYRSDISQKEIRKRAEENLARVGLGNRMDRYPRQLSGGQKQRVAIARALIAKPKIIFADEPCGALDSVSRMDVLTIFQELNAQGVTIAMVTHSEEDSRHSKRILLLEDGHLVSDKAVDRPLIAGGHVSEITQSRAGSEKSGSAPKPALSKPTPFVEEVAIQLDDSSERTRTIVLSDDKKSEGARGFQQKAQNLIKFLAQNPNLRTLESARSLVRKSPNKAISLRLLEPFSKKQELAQPILDLAQEYLVGNDSSLRLVAAERMADVAYSCAPEFLEKLFPHLLQMCRDEKGDIRHVGYTTLVRKFQPSQLQPFMSILLDGVSDKDPRIRADSANGFVHVGLEKSVQPLLKLLSDEDGRVRANAHETLWKLWGKEHQSAEKLAEKVRFVLGDTGNRIVADAAVKLNPFYPQDCKQSVERLLKNSNPAYIASGIYAAAQIYPDLIEKHFESIISNPSEKVQTALIRFYRPSLLRSLSAA